jgi:hypothetical protein
MVGYSSSPLLLDDPLVCLPARKSAFFDSLHIACALQLRAGQISPLDEREAKLAKAEVLRVSSATFLTLGRNKCSNDCE